MTFEEAYKKFEQINDKLEKGNLNLDESTKLYEEGVSLLKICYEELNKNKGKIVKLKKELDKIIEESFDGEE